MYCVADDRHRRPRADRGSPGRTHGNAETNPRIRVCSTVVLTALPPAPRTRSILPQPVPDNGMAHPRPTSLTTNIRISARELVVEPRVRLLPRHRRSLLRRLEPPHRPALDHHVHRPPGLGQCMMISAGWYYSTQSVHTSTRPKRYQCRVKSPYRLRPALHSLLSPRLARRLLDGPARAFQCVRYACRQPDG